METMHQGQQTACFVISVAARLLNVHPQTLRYYERAGLIAPSRSKGNIRLYSQEDIQRAMQIKRLIEDLGVNLRSEEHTSELQSRQYLVCRLLLEKKKKIKDNILTRLM